MAAEVQGKSWRRGCSVAHHKRDRSKRLQAAQQGTASLQGAKVAENLQLSRYTNPNTGHGSAAEDANALHDLLRGRPVELTGRSNVKDGPDRIVHGKVMIQTKYYQTARESVNAAFDGKTGLYRYKNQVLEVPKDQYSEALELMRQKIKEGRVPGSQSGRGGKAGQGRQCNLSAGTQYCQGWQHRFAVVRRQDSERYRRLCLWNHLCRSIRYFPVERPGPQRCPHAVSYGSGGYGNNCPGGGGPHSAVAENCHGPEFHIFRCTAGS